MALTDFSSWTSVLDLDDYEEVYCLYHSVKETTDYGFYRTVKGRIEGTYVVTASYIEDSLFLDSEKAKDSFLQYIQDRYCNGEDVDFWYEVKRVNDRDD